MSTLTVQAHISVGQTRRTEPVIRLGFWSSTVGTLLSVAYIVGVMVSEALSGFVLPPPEVTQTIASTITLLWAPTLVVMMVCVHQYALAEKRVFSLVAVAFMLGLAVLTCINRYVYLSVVRPAVADGEANQVARFLPYDDGSIMLAVESLGWGLFAGLAFLFAGAVFFRHGIERWLRWALVVTGIACLIYAFAFAVGIDWLGYIGPVAWALGVPIVCFLLTLFFYSAMQAERSIGT